MSKTGNIQAPTEYKNAGVAGHGRIGSDIQHSVLVVSASASFDEIVKRSLPPGDRLSTEFVRSVSLARRYIFERYYDLVVINSPLSDENGFEAAMDVAEQTSASVLLVVSKDAYEELAERMANIGVFLLAKPFTLRRMDNTILFLLAARNRFRALEKKVQRAEEKVEEQKVLCRAKILLVELRHMSEDEAHRHIGKLAMDAGISRGRAALRILEDLED